VVRQDRNQLWEKNGCNLMVYQQLNMFLKISKGAMALLPPPWLQSCGEVSSSSHPLLTNTVTIIFHKALLVCYKTASCLHPKLSNN